VENSGTASGDAEHNDHNRHDIHKHTWLFGVTDVPNAPPFATWMDNEQCAGCRLAAIQAPPEQTAVGTLRANVQLMTIHHAHSDFEHQRERSPPPVDLRCLLPASVDGRQKISLLKQTPFILDTVAKHGKSSHLQYVRR
jgi:hypothetical protein